MAGLVIIHTLAILAGPNGEVEEGAIAILVRHVDREGLIAFRLVVARLEAGPLCIEDAQGASQFVCAAGGKWIEITYSRPILRGRTNIFGTGADYGKAVSDGSPVWRAGLLRSRFACSP